MPPVKGRGLIRALNRKSTASGKNAKREIGLDDGPRYCEGCGAVWQKRTWRRNHPVTLKALDTATWARCPACQQVASEQYFGRISLRGAYLRENEAAIRRRLANVARRAEYNQPQRRVVSIEATPEGLEVLTTSQKLAHRMVAELKKAFGGRASFRWSDRDGSLFAIWSRAQ